MMKNMQAMQRLARLRGQDARGELLLREEPLLHREEAAAARDWASILA